MCVLSLLGQQWISQVSTFRNWVRKPDFSILMSGALLPLLLILVLTSGTVHLVCAPLMHCMLSFIAVFRGWNIFKFSAQSTESRRFFHKLYLIAQLHTQSGSKGVPYWFVYNSEAAALSVEQLTFLYLQLWTISGRGTLIIGADNHFLIFSISGFSVRLLIKWTNF